MLGNNAIVINIKGYFTHTCILLIGIGSYCDVHSFAFYGYCCPFRSRSRYRSFYVQSGGKGFSVTFGCQLKSCN